jgi:hypothetical protein
VTKKKGFHDWLQITANVGSIFEEPSQLIPQWLDHVIGEIQRQAPKFVAIHCQEVIQGILKGEVSLYRSPPV